MEHYLISVIPSEDVILKILEIRTALFRKFGLVSARALPVMIPVGFCNTGVEKNVFKAITPRSFTCTQSSGYTAEGNIFLPVEALSSVEEIERLIPKAAELPLFKTIPGLYLCAVEDSEDPSMIVSYTDSLINHKIMWRKSSLKMIKVESESKNWWESLEWQTIWEKKLR